MRKRRKRGGRECVGCESGVRTRREGVRVTDAARGPVKTGMCAAVRTETEFRDLRSFLSGAGDDCGGCGYGGVKVSVRKMVAGRCGTRRVNAGVRRCSLTRNRWVGYVWCYGRWYPWIRRRVVFLTRPVESLSEFSVSNRRTWSDDGASPEVIAVRRERDGWGYLKKTGDGTRVQRHAAESVLFCE